MRDDTVVGSKTGPGPSLPIGRPGSRFAYIDLTSEGLPCLADWEVADSIDVTSASDDEDAWSERSADRVISQSEMISFPLFRIWFVLILYMPIPSRRRSNSIFDSFLGGSTTTAA